MKPVRQRVTRRKGLRVGESMVRVWCRGCNVWMFVGDLEDRFDELGAESFSAWDQELIVKV